MIYIDRNSDRPTYIQLYETIREDISEGVYKHGDKLPPIRRLANELGVSKNTVDNAYQQLVVEGYATGRQGSGYIVEDVSEKIDLYKRGAENTKAGASSTDPGHEEADATKIKYDFRYGDLSPEFFPCDYWRKASNQLLSSAQAEKLSAYDDAKGDIRLREALSAYIKETRGIDAGADRIVICSGFVHSMSMICDLLEDRCSCVGMEDPGFPAAREMFHAKGMKTFSLRHYPEDRYFEDLEDSVAECLYVTPSHQFPMGSVMSVETRYRILQWASEHKGYIIEDDYDSQLRYHSRPVPALCSLCKDDRVIYIGTFSKSLSPALRINYVVLPSDMIARLEGMVQYRHSYVSWMDQRILAMFLEDGSFGRHVRKMSNICKVRHDLLKTLINDAFRDQVKIHGTNAGLHIVLEFEDGRKSADLIKRANEKGVRIYSVKDCFAAYNNEAEKLILLGYGRLTEKEIQKGIELLSP